MWTSTAGTWSLAHGAGHETAASLIDLPPLLLVGSAFLVSLGVLDKQSRADRGAAPDEPPPTARWAVIGLLLVAAVAHVPVIPEHLEEAPYMGVLFICFTLAAFGLACVLARWPSPPWFVAAGTLCAAAVAAYVATRLIAFPELADDVGRWAEPLGVISICAESAVVVLCLAVRRKTHATTAPSDPSAA
jgi:hypothetical protein